jgi:hypothetical protein
MVRIRLLIPFALIALVAVACGDDTGGATTTTSEAVTTTLAPVGDVADQFDELVAAAEAVRGLRFLSDPLLIVLSPDELAERVRADIEEEIDPDEIVIDEAFFELLGILDPGIDLAQAYLDLYSEQVAGFYDTDTKEMVIGSEEEMTALTKTIVVHELIHALADQHFDLGARFDVLIDEERYHEAAALQALAEGEATYFQVVYLQSLPVTEQLEMVTESLEADMTVLESLPDWIGDDLTFPYDSGFVFVERLVAENGIAAVDQAYDLVPTTTEQILHPEAYFGLERGAEVRLPGNATLPGYEVYEEGELGEWNLDLFLLDGVTDGRATVAAAGWGGDDYRILWNGSEVALVYRFVGDTPRDGGELEAALLESVGARMAVGEPAGGEELEDGGTTPTVFEGDDYAWVHRDGGQVTFVAASDPAAGRTLAEVLAPVD